MEKKNFFWWTIFVILAIWQFPQFLVSLVMLPFLGKRKVVADKHFNLCFEAENMMGGISLGPFAFVSPRMSYPESIAHEFDGHTVDSKIFGPIYLLVVGLPSMLNAAFHFTECYYDFFCEKWANKHAGLSVDEECHLYFTKNENS